MHSVIALLALAAGIHASPIAPRQAVTASIAPPAAAPAGCMPTFTGSFGIAVQNISMPTAAAKRQVTQISDGQIQAPTAKPMTVPMTVGMVSMITDGQIQAGFKTITIMPVTTPMSTKVSTALAVTEFSDGQPQVPMSTAIPMTTAKPVITAAPVTVLSDGQPQAPLSTAKPSVSAMITSIVSKAPVASATTMMAPAMSMMPTVGGQQIVACATNGTLELTLANGILKDSHGRTGYVASNFQFQFDDPPQAGAIFTAGFSVCASGSLALGGSNVFYQCLSGSFYNLYTVNWAPQCSPVTIETLMLQNCGT
ncbi:hypothetical protein MMC17_001622 [Xylographa soralifera]|nr:hypothetical protein [Xylographa soralifera]